MPIINSKFKIKVKRKKKSIFFIKVSRLIDVSQAQENSPSFIMFIDGCNFIILYGRETSYELTEG